MWNKHASRPRVRALRYYRVTSYEATMSAMAYGGHRKAAVEWTEGRASAASALLLRSNTVRERVKEWYPLPVE